MRLGDLDALKKEVSKVNDSYTEMSANQLGYDILRLIDNAPTVDISKEVWNKSNELLEKRLTYLGRPQGEWEYKEIANSTITGYWCSCCHIGSQRNYNFCPNCGASMVQGEKDG